MQYISVCKLEDNLNFKELIISDKIGPYYYNSLHIPEDNAIEIQ